MAPDPIDNLLPQVPEWDVVDGHHFAPTYPFEAFVDGLQLVNEAAEAEGHHPDPDVLLRWGSVRVDVWTHKIDGLMYSDFVLAAKHEDASLGRGPCP